MSHTESRERFKDQDHLGTPITTADKRVVDGLRAQHRSAGDPYQRTKNEEISYRTGTVREPAARGLCAQRQLHVADS